MNRNIQYVVTQEGKYYVSQCLNVNVSSFGETIDEAVANLKEAVELYYQDEDKYQKVENTLVGDLEINV